MARSLDGFGSQTNGLRLLSPGQDGEAIADLGEARECEWIQTESLGYELETSKALGLNYLRLSA